MEASEESVSVRTSYNFSGLSFTPSELFKGIQEAIPEMTFTYDPDFDVLYIGTGNGFRAKYGNITGARSTCRMHHRQ